MPRLNALMRAHAEAKYLSRHFFDPPALDAQLIENEVAVELHAQLSTLNEQEQKVIELRYGLNGEPEHSYREIGKIFGVAGERVRQLELRALRKLRHPSRYSKILESGYLLL